MGFLDHQGESEFPFNKEIVFNAMVKAIPTVKGMKIENADKLQIRIVGNFIFPNNMVETVTFLIKIFSCIRTDLFRNIEKPNFLKNNYFQKVGLLVFYV